MTGAGRDFKGEFLKVGSISGNCSFSFLSPHFPLVFLNTVLQILTRAGVLLPFTTWHVLRLHGWLWHVDPFKKGLKTILF